MVTSGFSRERFRVYSLKSAGSSGRGHTHVSVTANQEFSRPVFLRRAQDRRVAGGLVGVAAAGTSLVYTQYGWPTPIEI